MPKIPIDYSKTIIYKIVCNDLNVNQCYVGHTTDMTKRKWGHKSVCNNEKNKGHNHKIYKIIRENGGWDNWNMLLVEKFPCKDKYDACKREREVYEEIDAKMNTVRPYLTQEEIKQYHKQYDKQYYQTNKEYKKEKFKEYNKANKQKISAYKKKYREANKQKISERNKEKIECLICGSIVRRSDIAQHKRTAKHTEYLNSI
jgi:hypothetical protein